jgi:heat shock protein HslJ
MALPVVPLLIIGVCLAACAATLKKPSPDRKLYSLAGSEWGFKDGTDRFVQFGSNGEMRGSGGCNNFFGTYDLNGSQLTIGPIAATKKYCGDRMAGETKFLNALQNAHRIEATHFVLNLFDKDGDKLLELSRRDWD